MRVKIGDEWHDSNKEPVCVQFTEEELQLLSFMDSKSSPERKFGSFPTWYTTRDRANFMKE